MLRSLDKPVIFAGPSLPELDAADRERVELRPPIRRGDAPALLERSSPGTVLLIDGAFSSSLAVTPTECRELIEQGWTVIGAASMGALRASELWSIGMIGLGEVFTLYRLGVLLSDADVAVAMDPDTYEELSISTVHVRAILQHLVQRGEIDRPDATRLLDAARRIHFLERGWARCRSAWEASGMAPRAVELASALAREPRHHPKMRDARLALRAVLSDLWIEGA